MKKRWEEHARACLLLRLGVVIIVVAHHSSGVESAIPFGCVRAWVRSRGRERILLFQALGVSHSDNDNQHQRVCVCVFVIAIYSSRSRLQSLMSPENNSIPHSRKKKKKVVYSVYMRVYCRKTALAPRFGRIRTKAIKHTGGVGCIFKNHSYAKTHTHESFPHTE